MEVSDDEVELLLLQRAQPILSARGGDHIVIAKNGQRVPQHQEHDLVVVYQQNPLRCVSAHLPCTGFGHIGHITTAITPGCPPLAQSPPDAIPY